MSSGLRGRGGRVPTEGAGCAWRRGFAMGEEGDGFGAQDGASAVEHGVSEAGEVFGGGEKAGVSGDAAEDESVFVLDFALDDSLAKLAASILARAGRGWRQFAGWCVRATLRVLFCAFVGGRRDLGTRLLWRIERGVRHGQRAEDFALAENIERFFRDALEGGGEDDESDVAVLGAGAGIGGERRGESGNEKFVASMRLEKQLLVGGQA